MADRDASPLGGWTRSTNIPKHASGRGPSLAGYGRLFRGIAIVGVASAVVAPAFVTAQVRTETVEVREAPVAPVVSAPVTPAPPAPAPAPLAPDEASKVERKVMNKAMIQKEVRVDPDPAEVKRLLILNNMAERWTRQFRPILRVEYQFMRTVCDPTKEERILIARAGFNALDETVKNYTGWQSNRNRLILPGGGRVSSPDFRKDIQDGLVAAVKAQLSPTQAERYRSELEARSAEAKRVAILSFVAKLDQSLLLSAAQRDKLTDSLSSHWNESWAFGFQNHDFENEYFPRIPDPLIVVYLSDDQKRIWAGFPKVQVNVTGGVNFNIVAGDMNVENAPLDDEFPDAIAKENPKPESKK